MNRSLFTERCVYNCNFGSYKVVVFIAYMAYSSKAITLDKKISIYVNIFVRRK